MNTWTAWKEARFRYVGWKCQPRKGERMNARMQVVMTQGQEKQIAAGVCRCEDVFRTEELLSTRV